ncbi:MAG: hypothetical protein EOO01_38080 [Chitinophagaceae bacterium]|nr:MAG: hypothetical protein EOO01_38080 [Chitinophagaceae bacterium]
MAKAQKVSKTIVPLHYSLRKVPELVPKSGYYVCFGDNEVRACTLLEVYQERRQVLIRIPGKNKDYSDHQLYWDEIGSTQEEAVRNTVTS